MCLTRTLTDHDRECERTVAIANCKKFHLRSVLSQDENMYAKDSSAVSQMETDKHEPAEEINADAGISERDAIGDENIPTPDDSNADKVDDTNHYEIERIVTHRFDYKDPSQLFYKVKWEGYPASDNSWVKSKDIHANEMLNAYWSQAASKGSNVPEAVQKYVKRSLSVMEQNPVSKRGRRRK